MKYSVIGILLALVFTASCQKALIKGDILPHKLHKRFRRALSKDHYSRDYLWKNGIIYYKFNANLGKHFQKTIKSAIHQLEDKTCLQFLQHQNEIDYIEFQRGEGCYSHVGRQGGRQVISLDLGCQYKHIVVHELLHALGLYHENTRVDSGLYINVLWWNIQTGAERNFQSIYRDDGINTMQYPYDYNSVMHYQNKEFSKNGQNTLQAIDDLKKVLGNHIGLSKIDIKKINDAYKCKIKSRKKCRDKYKHCKQHQRYCPFKWFANKYCKETCNNCT